MESFEALTIDNFTLTDAIFIAMFLVVLYLFYHLIATQKENRELHATTQQQKQQLTEFLENKESKWTSKFIKGIINIQESTIKSLKQRIKELEFEKEKTEAYAMGHAYTYASLNNKGATLDKCIELYNEMYNKDVKSPICPNQFGCNNTGFGATMEECTICKKVVS